MDSFQESLPTVVTGGLHRVSARTGYKYRSDYHTQVNFNCFDKMFSDGLLCDVTLVADGMEIEAHKVILAACSAFFYFKFSSDRKLGLQSRIQVEHVDYETLSSVVNFFYKSEVEITEGNLEGLLAAACYLAVPVLQEACWDFMEVNLDPRNCLEIGSLAKKYRCENLVPLVDAFTVEHFPEVIENGGYSKLTYNEISKLMSRDALFATEDELFECAVQWIRFDVQNRKGYVQSLISKVKLSLISELNILQKMAEEQWLKSDPQFLDQFINSRILEQVIPSTINRRLSSDLLLVVGLTFDKYLSLEIYDFQENSWSEGPEILKIQCDFGYSVAIHGTKVYCSHGIMLKSIDVGNHPTKMLWSSCSMPENAVCDFTIASFNDTIYKVGGISKGKRLAIAEKFDAGLRKWKRVADMSEGRYHLGLGVLNTSLYAVGGETDEDLFSNLVEFYADNTDSWHTMPAMTVGRQSPGVGALGDSLIVVGGWSRVGPLKQVESFNSVQRTWSRLPDMNVARNAPGVIAVNGQLYVIGGRNWDADYINSVEIYDPKSNTWSMLPSKMNVAKIFVTAGVIDKSKIQFYRSMPSKLRRRRKYKKKTKIVALSP